MDAGLSLEVFTPRSAAGVNELLARLGAFAAIGPAFIGVSGTSPSALAIIESIKKVHCVRPMLHLPRTELTEESAISLVESALRLGTRDLLVLGGAPGSMQPPAVGGGFGSATELVTFLKRRFGDRLRVGVCGYPRESRGECDSYDADLEQLAAQVAAGAELVLSLPTFDATALMSFAADAKRAGVACPVKAGLLPLTSDMRRLCASLHVTPPDNLAKQIDDAAARGGEAAVRRIADAHLASLVSDLIAAGGHPPHVYTLNEQAALASLAAAGYTPLKHRVGQRPAALGA